MSAYKIQQWSADYFYVSIGNYDSRYLVCLHIYAKIHVFIKDLRVCANNPKLEDFIIYLSLLGISAHVRNTF